MTDQAGNETYHAQYGTYGELRRLTDADGNETTPAEADQTYLYNGQYGVETEENGLYYMRTRYYNTSIKRFMNRDIINGDPTNAQSLNRFSYVQGNPISYTDPFGLSPEGVDYWLKYGHGILDLAGFIPGIGDVADFINALWYFQQGDQVTAILSLIAVIPVLGSIASKLFKGAGKAGSKFMKYLNETGITDVITNWLKHASNSLSDVFKGGEIDLSAKNMEKVKEFLGKTKQKVSDAIDKLVHGKGYIKKKELNDLPQNVQNAFKQYDNTGWKGNVSGKTQGTKAGKKYQNSNGKLPTKDAAGNSISYKEWDVNNKQPGKNRDGERVVTGLDGSIYYTDSHYGEGKSLNGLPAFVKIK